MEIKPQISTTVCQNKDFLKKLARTKSERKIKRILKSASCDQLLAIVEICLNFVRSRFKLTARQKNRLLPYVDLVRSMSRSRTFKGARKIMQKGSGAVGLFGALLTPIILELARAFIKETSKD
jgi:hypothetical protein